MSRGRRASRMGGSIVLLAAACLLAPVCLLGPGAARAQVVGGFPRLDASARGTGLGGNLTAMAEGPEAVSWNPAGLLQLERPAVGFTYADLFGLGLVSQTVVQIGYPLLRTKTTWDHGVIRKEKLPAPARRAFGLGLSSLRGDLGEDSYRETEISFAYSWILPADVRAGLAWRVLLAQSTVDGGGGHGQALNLGLQRPLGPFRLGVTAANLASWMNWDEASAIVRGATEYPESDDPLAERWSAGLAWSPVRSLSATLQGDWRGGNFTFLQTGAAAEWRPLEPLALRAAIRRREDVLGGRNELSAGAGVRVANFLFDYGVQANARDLGTTQRLGAAVEF